MGVPKLSLDFRQLVEWTSWPHLTAWLSQDGFLSRLSTKTRRQRWRELGRRQIRGMNAPHHLEIIFQEKFSEGTSHLKRTGFRAEESVSTVGRLKGRRTSLEWRLDLENDVYCGTSWQSVFWSSEVSWHSWRGLQFEVMFSVIQPVMAAICLLAQKGPLTPGSGVRNLGKNFAVTSLSMWNSLSRNR